MATDSLNLEALAESCLQSAKTINAFLSKDDRHDRLAFDPLALPAFPKCDEATEHARTNLRNAARTMYDLATGPEQYLVESSLISVSTAKGLEAHTKTGTSLLPASFISSIPCDTFAISRFPTLFQTRERLNIDLWPKPVVWTWSS